MPPNVACAVVVGRIWDAKMPAGPMFELSTPPFAHEEIAALFELTWLEKIVAPGTKFGNGIESVVADDGVQSNSMVRNR